MWRLIEYLIVAAVVLLSVTEFFYPLVAGKPLFGSFRRKNRDTQNNTRKNSLPEKVKEAKEKVEEIKAVQNEVDQHYRSAEQLKEDADRLLNTSKDSNP